MTLSFDLKLLGPPTLLENGKPVQLLRKSLALLSFLSMEQPRLYERAYLGSLFWPDFPQSRADDSLRQSLRSLRKVLDLPSGPSFFSKSGSSVGLNLDHPLRIDALRLLHPPASCRLFHDPEQCPPCELQIHSALLEIRGPFMEGLSLPDCEEFEAWLTATRESLLVRVRWGVERLIRLYEKNGKTDLALRALDRALRMDPLDEDLHARTMLLLLESGNRTAALHQYETCRRILREHLGTEPAPETRAILKRILSGAKPSPGLRMDGAGTLPDLPLAPEWRPATALYLALETPGEEGPETLSSAVGEALGRIAEAAKSLGGTIGRVHDNGVLVWFGIRDQPEGAARRAARTALEIAKTLETSPKGVYRGMVLHGGIHSGRILRGAPADPPDPTGAVFRTAMALSMQAKGGAVLVSEATAPLLRGQYALSEGEDLLVLGARRKGFFLLALFGEEGQTGDPKEDRPPQFFGREPELRLFLELWDRSRGGVLLVEGEAGIGKSALVRSFLDFVNRRGTLIRRIDCAPQYMDSPFFPVLRLIREISGVPEGLGSEEAYARLLSYVRSIANGADGSHGAHGDQGGEDGEGAHAEERRAVALLGSFFSLPPHPDFPLPPLPPAALREEISGVLLTLLKARAETGSYVLLVEDLHWVDASTGELLRRILSDPSFTGRIFFLLTTRTGEDPPWLSSLPDIRTIRLSPLAEEDSRSLIGALTRDALLSEAEASRILKTADGVPLFLEELTREALERGALSPSSESVSVPATLGEVLASRLDRLASARPILQRAALYGRTVPLDLL
ncbi:MAG: AAA family ATPase, partial [Leptospirales bacterium]